jgi:hypothetical protein
MSPRLQLLVAMLKDIFATRGALPASEFRGHSVVGLLVLRLAFGVRGG